LLAVLLMSRGACTASPSMGVPDASGSVEEASVDGSEDAGPLDGGAMDGCMVVPTSNMHSGDLPCLIAAVLMAKCQPCHQKPPRNGAHFSLLSYEDLVQPFGLTGLLRWQRMAQVIELDGSPHMPPNTPTLMAPQLMDQELMMLRDYFAMCAPPVVEGTGCDRPPGE
jgi:hypothetical protein